ncbi:AMP-binding protein [Xanthobacter sp. KR7-65]|uniref:AMP-binding protein n=1 Tax=Xanthobacter sp. KR7-65 TaxID=3156612 RepID=UPI0032B371E4
MTERSISQRIFDTAESLEPAKTVAFPSASAGMGVLPMAERTIGRILARATALYGTRPFVRWRGETFSFSEMNRRANKTANALSALGITRGTRVAILCFNRLEYLDLWFGLAKIGAVQVPLNTGYRAPQILHTLSRADIPFIVVQRELAEEFTKLGTDVTGRCHVLTLDGPISTGLAPQQSALEGLVAAASDIEPPDPKIDGTDIGAIMNTSGTTGLAKGVLLPHAQQYWLGYRIADALSLRADDVFYNFYPLFHNTSQAMIVVPVMLAGAQLVLTEKFSLSNFWPDVRSNGVSIFYYIGEILHLLVKASAGDEARGTRLRAGIGIGGAPRDVAAFQRIHNVPLGACYGSTEGNVPVFRPLGEGADTASAGRVLPEFEVRIVDPTGEPVPVGEVGEIAIRSDEPAIVFAGYDGDPQATSEVRKDGWYHSGDAGRFDAEGNLYFVARIKDVIRVKGESVSAFEVEDALVSFAGVQEAAAIAVPSEIGGDEVKAVIVLSPGAVLDPTALVAHCNRLLPKFSVPRYFEFVEALPKTLTNKIQKNVLRETPFTPRTWDRLQVTISRDK